MLTVIPAPFYPPRPLSGGPLPMAEPKFGRWVWSPKYNGWRALVHTPTGTIFNRQGKRLTIESEFDDILRFLKGSRFEWLDCEALERRHQIGQGSLIVLDAPIVGNALERFEALTSEIPIHNCPEKPPDHSLLLAPQMTLEHEGALELWDELQGFNKDFGCEFYEGLVCKKLESTYAAQVRDPDAKCRSWMKHRWAW